MVYKILLKIRSKLRTLVRHFQPQPKPEAKSLALIEKVQAATKGGDHKKSPTFVVDGRCFLLPAIRNDGVGIQAMVRICVMLLARQAKATYIHLPFFELEHQDIDPVGRSLTQEDWAATWEKFLNLGKDEFHIGDLADAMGKHVLAKQMSASDHHFGGTNDLVHERLPNIVAKIRNADSRVSGIYTFNLGLCQQHRECSLFLDSEFIEVLQERFETNGYRQEENLFYENYLNIAIHIRRGDVWNACQAGSQETMYRNKLVGEEYYVLLLQQLQNCFKLSSKPILFHIFSDGLQDDFCRFTFRNENDAFVELESGIVIENIRFHLRRSSISTLYHMIKAPIFVPGKSTFSVLAALLTKSYVLYDEEICEFYQFNLLAKYMKENPKIISRAELGDKIVEVMEATG